MLDEELMELIRASRLPQIPYVFISAVTGYGIQELKDLLWTELNKESNLLSAQEEQEVKGFYYY